MSYHMRRGAIIGLFDNGVATKLEDYSLTEMQVRPIRSVRIFTT